MNLWHLTPDTPRLPERVSPNERVDLVVGSWPVEPDQAVWIDYNVTHPDGRHATGQAWAIWQCNEGGNSTWRATVGPFARGAQVRYQVLGRSPAGEIAGPRGGFTVGARLHLALMWHQHQPLYKDTRHPTQQGSYRQPWVRLHALRDYYSMAALIAEHPDVHLTINLTPVLLWQLTDYLEQGATDRALELTLKPAETLTGDERAFVLSEFFDADWHHQIYPHPRYRELLELRTVAEAFDAQELRDLQMWFNLAWFGSEFRAGEVELVTGERVSVKRFVDQGRGFDAADVEAMVAEQYKLMRAVIPLHRQLQERGQIEVATSPFYHPILPILIDSDDATIDRPGARHPRRFAHPEDAEAQVGKAVACYERHFGRPPRGMWPAEGAVSRASVPVIAGAGLAWIASDQGVLARSGRWGYEAGDPEVLCRPYRVEEAGHAISIFFRDTRLSDEIGFHYQGYRDERAAARDFLEQIRRRFAERFTDEREHVLGVILDGENAWGAYRDDARPFLHALYGLLEEADDLITVTFDECLTGDPDRDLSGHPLASQTPLHDLWTGSWIDENGSRPGVDLGTWIGEDEENRAWELLREARASVAAGATPTTRLDAFEALYVAEGSDWFWWFGDDQDSGNDAEFDDLFRMHLRNAYRQADLEPPVTLDRPIVPRRVLWSFTDKCPRIFGRDQLTIRTHCPGTVRWRLDDSPTRQSDLSPAGGVMAGVRRFHVTLGPFPAGSAELSFRFLCSHQGCPGVDPCCRGDVQTVRIDDGMPT